MKIIFAGTPPFAAAALTALVVAGHQIVLVLTQPDRPAGRGLKLRPSAVAEQAEQLGLTLLKPVSLRNDDIQATLRAIAPDAMVVAAYGLMLPQPVLDIPKYGCINIHGSLLPRWRGAAPIQRAIEAGDIETGIAIMQMDAGLDTGPVLLTKACPILPADTSGTLFDRLTALSMVAITDAMEKLPSLQAIAQPLEGISYAKKIDKAEAQIDWTHPAEVIERRLRAFDPAPGCESVIGGEKLKIWHAAVKPSPVDITIPPGTIIEASPDQLTVQCGVDALGLITVQKPGGKRMAIADYLRGSTLQTGWRFK